MDHINFKYSVAIRTLGKAGAAYETTIRSLMAQTIPPQRIIVYIAEGYQLPMRVADEIYVCCKKGMAHQRALSYEEIPDDYVLLCDDDLFFSEDAVEQLFIAMQENEADCISANMFPNHDMRFNTKIIKAILHGEYPSCSKSLAFRIRCSSYFSYCNNPYNVMESQSCAGACMLIKKSVNNSLCYEDEVWMDQFPYTSGQDQIFAHKLYRYGYRLFIHYAVGVFHLDAKTGHIKDEVQADFNKRKIRYIEWYRSIYEPGNNWQKMLAVLSYYSYWSWLLVLSLISFILRRNKFKVKNSFKALAEARQYIKSEDYNKIPKWKVVR